MLLSITVTFAACSKSDGDKNNGNNNPQDTKIPKVAAAGYSFLLKTDGTLWATGDNYEGQMGDGTTTRKYVWAKIADNVADFDVSLEWGMAFMLKKDGTAWLAGSAPGGQFGDSGVTTNSSTWVKVAGGVAGVCAGYRASFLIKNDGTLWTCGSDYYGDAGLPGYDPSIPPYHYTVFTWKQTATNAASVKAQANTLLLKTDGTLWATGPEIPAPSGASAPLNSRSWVQVADNVATMSSGLSHSLLVKKDGTVWVQGEGNSGALGLGRTTTISYSWTQVADNGAAVSAGEHFSLLLKKDGTVWATGNDNLGQLGDGSISDKYSWAKVADSAASISAGSGYSLIVKKDGTLWGAGSFDRGQFGDTSIHFYSGYTTNFVKIKMP